MAQSHPNRERGGRRLKQNVSRAKFRSGLLQFCLVSWSDCDTRLTARNLEKNCLPVCWGRGTGMVSGQHFCCHVARNHFLLNPSKYVSTLKINANIFHSQKEMKIFRIIMIISKRVIGLFMNLSCQGSYINIIFICGKIVNKVLVTNIHVKIISRS